MMTHLKIFIINMLTDWIQEYNLLKFVKHLAKTVKIMYNKKVIII